MLSNVLQAANKGARTVNTRCGDSTRCKSETRSRNTCPHSWPPQRTRARFCLNGYPTKILGRGATKSSPTTTSEPHLNSKQQSASECTSRHVPGWPCEGRLRKVATPLGETGDDPITKHFCCVGWSSFVPKCCSHLTSLTPVLRNFAAVCWPHGITSFGTTWNSGKHTILGTMLKINPKRSPDSENSPRCNSKTHKNLKQHIFKF